MLRKSSLSLLLLLLSFTVSGTDCNVLSFYSLTGYVNLTVKAKVVALPDFNSFYEVHQKREHKYVFLITKRYYGFEQRDTIRIDPYISWDNSNRLMGYPVTTLRFEMNEEVLLNLYPEGNDYRFGSCGEYMLRINNDSVFSAYSIHKPYALKDFEQELTERYGKFIQLPYTLIRYDDPEFMEASQHSATHGEFQLKTSLPDGAYYVYALKEDGFVLVEEVYLQQQHYIGRYKSYYHNGRHKIQACYTVDGLPDDYYREYYNNEKNTRKTLLNYDEGVLLYMFTNWPDGSAHEVIEYGKDTASVWVNTPAGQKEFSGIEVKGKRIGEYRLYEDGVLSHQYYTDEKGIQGYYIHYATGSSLVSLYQYRDGLLQGKAMQVDWGTASPLQSSKGVITSPLRYKRVVKEMNFKDNLLEGPQTTYYSKKDIKIEYFEKGVYTRCEGCFEF